MKKFNILRGLLAGLVGLALLVPAAEADAAGKGKAKPKVSTEAPAALETKLKVTPKGLKFGMKLKDVLKVYNNVIEADFKPRWKQVEPGIQMERLKNEIQTAKDNFRLSYQDFDGKPASLDGSPLRGEYTHNNKEGFMRISRKGKVRRLFFIRGKLLDEYKLGSQSKFGIDFKQAVTTIQKRLGKEVEGRPLKADEEKGRVNEEVDFSDGKVHLRLVNLGQGKLGIAYVDLDTEGRLSSLRKDKGEKQDDVDDSVKAVLRAPSPSAGPPEKKKK
jgi:hypothetical protein